MMKENHFFSVLIMTIMYVGVVHSQNIPTNLLLSDLETVENQYNAGDIQSTQTVNSGTIIYRASNAIVLKPGFHAKAGSNFRAAIDDFSNCINIMTYNIHKQDYYENGKVIKTSGADVVAVQEISRYPLSGNFNRLKEQAGMEGEFVRTMHMVVGRYGIALLWKSSLGTPNVTYKRIESSSADTDSHRAYIVAEFTDFCLVSTHYSLAPSDQIEMTNSILKHSVVKACQSAGKPVYIAGDLNPKDKDSYPSSVTPIDLFASSGFEVLNYTDRIANHGYYIRHHATSEEGGLLDLILGHNQNPNHEIFWRGVPECLWASDLPNGYTGGEYKDWRFVISDHLPYLIKVKLK